MPRLGASLSPPILGGPSSAFPGDLGLRRAPRRGLGTARGRGVAPILAAAALGLVACGDRAVFIEKPWPDDHVAVALLTDDEARPIAPMRVVAPGEPAARWQQVASAARARVFARSWAPEVRAPNGGDLLACGLTQGGVGPPAPAATGSWVTPIADLDDVETLAFAPERPPVTAFDLRLERCAVDMTCPGFGARSLRLPEGFRPRRVAHLGGYALTVSAPRHRGEPNRLARATPEGVALLDADARIGRGNVRALAWDPRPAPGRVRLVFDTGRVVVLDEEGRYRGEHAGPRAFRFDAGIDGESLLTGPDGLFRYASGSTIAVDITDTLPAFIRPGLIDEVFVYDRSSRMIRVGQDIYEWTGRGWQLAYAAEPFDVVSQVGADREYRGLTGEFELVRAEDPVTGDWIRYARPFDAGHRFRAIDGLLDTRFVVVGDRASAAVWSGTSWCLLPHGGPASTLTHVASSTYGADAYAIGSDEDAEAPILLYIDVPDA